MLNNSHTRSTASPEIATQHPPLVAAKLQHSEASAAPLPVRAQLRQAELYELPELHRAAEAALGGPIAPLTSVERVFRHDPTSILAIARGAALVGGSAYLHLNDKGHRSFHSGELNIGAPALSDLAAPAERPTTIYWWVHFGPGATRETVPDLLAFWHSERLRHADIWGAGLTAAGARFMERLGLRPAPSAYRDLYRFARS